jgi:hypothetical protein
LVSEKNPVVSREAPVASPTIRKLQFAGTFEKGS